MSPQRPLSLASDAGVAARSRYRWLLLAGWSLLISTGLSFAITMPRVQPGTAILIALSALAFVVYSLSIKRYWPIGLGVLISLMAMMVWIVTR